MRWPPTLRLRDRAPVMSTARLPANPAPLRDAPRRPHAGRADDEWATGESRVGGCVADQEHFGVLGHAFDEISETEETDKWRIHRDTLIIEQVDGEVESAIMLPLEASSGPATAVPGMGSIAIEPSWEDQDCEFSYDVWCCCMKLLLYMGAFNNFPETAPTRLEVVRWRRNKSTGGVSRPVQICNLRLDLEPLGWLIVVLVIISLVMAVALALPDAWLINLDLMLLG